MLGHFGEALEERRLVQCLSRRVLAQRTGLSVAALRDLGSGASVPPDEVLEVLAQGLETTPDALLLGAGIVPGWVRSRARSDPQAFVEAIRALEGRPGDPPPPVLPDAPVPEVPYLVTDLGSLYQTDCIPFLRGMEDESVDLVFADPPFNLAKDYGEDFDDGRPEQTYLDWSVRWMEHAVRVLKPGGSLFLYNLPKWALRLGGWLAGRLEFRHWIAVDLKFSLPIQGRLYPSHYSLLYFTKGRRPNTFEPPRLPLTTCRHCGGELRDYGGYKSRMNPLGVNLTDVWTDLAPVRHKRYKHRAANQLPLKLLDRVLDIASKPGDLVLDPFGGSGTTFVAAELKGRRWLGIEVGDCEVIFDRFEDLAREEEHLESIRERVNTLFTPDVLELRAKNGHDTSRYRLLEGSKPKKRRRASRTDPGQRSLFGT